MLQPHLRTPEARGSELSAVSLEKLRRTGRLPPAAVNLPSSFRSCLAVLPPRPENDGSLVPLSWAREGSGGFCPAMLHQLYRSLSGALLHGTVVGLPHRAPRELDLYICMSLPLSIRLSLLQRVPKINTGVETAALEGCVTSLGA